MSAPSTSGAGAAGEAHAGPDAAAAGDGGELVLELLEEDEDDEACDREEAQDGWFAASQQQHELQSAGAGEAGTEAGAGPSAADEPAWKDYATVFTNDKAGMGDNMVHSKEHVQRVVYEMSQGSPHFENERRKERAADERASRMEAHVRAATEQALQAARRRADAALTALELTRRSDRAWALFDMDQFFFAVHAQKDPKLHEVPVAVGGIGMISTANYAARRYGVRSAMPGFIAKKLCPQLTFVRSDFAEYSRVSKLFGEALRPFDPEGTAYQAGLDECYVDLKAASAARDETPAETCAAARAAIKAATGITVSAGLAPSRQLAKVASDLNKPDGQYVLPSNRGAVVAFARGLPLRKIGGIGRMAERTLQRALGVKTCGDLYEKRGEVMLLESFLQSSVPFYLRVMNGCFSADPPQREGRKGCSEERTFQATANVGMLASRLNDIAADLARRLVELDLHRRFSSLTLKVKFSDYVVRQSSLSHPPTVAAGLEGDEAAAWLAERMTTAALPLLKEHARHSSIRLLGLRAAGFDKGSARAVGQQTLAQALERAEKSPAKRLAPEGGRDANVDITEVDVAEQARILEEIQRSKTKGGTKKKQRRERGQASLAALWGKR